MSLTLKNGAMIWRDSPEINHLFQNNFKKREGIRAYMPNTLNVVYVKKAVATTPPCRTNRADAGSFQSALSSRSESRAIR